MGNLFSRSQSEIQSSNRSPLSVMSHSTLYFGPRFLSYTPLESTSVFWKELRRIASTSISNQPSEATLQEWASENPPTDTSKQIDLKSDVLDCWFDTQRQVEIIEIGSKVGLKFVVDAERKGNLKVIWNVKEKLKEGIVKYIGDDVCFEQKISEGLGQSMELSIESCIEIGAIVFGEIVERAQVVHVEGSIDNEENDATANDDADKNGQDYSHHVVVKIEEETISVLKDDIYSFAIIIDDGSEYPTCRHVSLGTITRRSDGHLEARILVQKAFLNNVPFILQEIYGLHETQQNSSEDQISQECVICISDLKTTAVLPCRHFCLCSKCADVLRHQSQKCPICRQRKSITNL